MRRCEEVYALFGRRPWRILRRGVKTGIPGLGYRARGEIAVMSILGFVMYELADQPDV